MPHENFFKNLRTVSNKQISVAHVCRKMEINRQQFNKYLSGQIYPSKYNLNKICQYFQLSEEEFNLKPSEFRLIASKSHQLESNPGKIKLNNTIDSISSLSNDLSRYEGYYYSHFHSPEYPGYINRSLIHIYQYENNFYSTSIEHLDLIFLTLFGSQTPQSPSILGTPPDDPQPRIVVFITLFIDNFSFIK